MIKAVLFDRDGVIIDSEPIHISSVIKTFKNMGITISEEDKRQIIGKHPIDYTEYFKKKYTFSVYEFIQNQKYNFYKMFPTAKIFEDMVYLINRLKTQGYKLALTTTAGLDSTKIVLERTKLNNVFDVIVTLEDCNKRKPNPDPYLITAKKLKMNPNKCIVVEDSSVGLAAAKNADMKCIVISNQNMRGQDFSKADFILNKPKEIESILKSNLSTL